jgi:hypothetical protein
MKEKDQFLEKYRKFLNKQNEHLSFELLSLYLNFSVTLSKKENHYFEQHLSICQDCREKFNEVFDSELDLEEKTTLFLRDVNTQRLPSDSVLQFTYASRIDPDDQSQNIRTTDGTISIDLFFKSDHILLNVRDFPDEYLGRALKFTVPETQSTGRMIGLEQNKQITLSFLAGERPAQISKILLEFAPPTPEPVQKSSWLQKISIGDIPPSRLAAAAVVLIFITIAYFIFYPDRPGPDHTLISHQFGTEAFQENPLLENFIDRTLRSETEVTNLLPINGDTLSTPIYFKWQQTYGKAVYSLTIYNNKNREVWRQSTELQQLIFKETLAPGLYYWKLQVDDKGVVVQKFYIK